METRNFIGTRLPFTDFKGHFILIFLAFLISLDACQTPQENKQKSPTKSDLTLEANPIKLDVSKNYKRIITIGDAITETVISLGDSNKIVAIGRSTPKYPNFQRPKVGYDLTLRTKYILSHKPDLVIADSEAISISIIRELEEKNIACLVLEPNTDLNSTKEFIIQIGEILHKNKQTQKLITKIDKQLEEVKQVRGSRKDSLKVMYLLARGSGLLFMGGYGTSYDAIIRLAGAKNAAFEVEGLQRVTEDDMTVLNPDFLLMSQQSYDSFQGKIHTMPALLASQAYRLGRIIIIDESLLKNPGLSIGETALELSRKLYESQYFQPLLPVNPNPTPTPERSKELEIISPEE